MEGNAGVRVESPLAAGSVSGRSIPDHLGKTEPTQHAKDVDIGKLIDTRPLGLRQVAALSLCFLVVLLDGFDNQTIGVLARAMSEDLGIPLKQFGPVFGFAAAGMIAGAMIVGPLADRVGRKRMLVLSTLCFGLGSILTAHVHTVAMLMAVRFLTGIGLGGVLPNVIALASEFSPKRLSRTAISLMVCGIPGGAIIGGLTAAALLPTHGWTATYYIGGIAPIFVAAAIAAWMPESARHLIAHGAPASRIANSVKRLLRDVPTDGIRFVTQDAATHRVDPKQNLGMRAVFREGRTAPTLFLWVTYFMNLMVIYCTVSWLPAVIVASGRSMNTSVAAITAFSVGGVFGALTQGPLMNRLGASRMLTIQWLLAMLYALSLGTMQVSELVIVVATGISGYAMIGIQSGLNALAAETYPTSIRATGTALALSVGRLGSIVGPLLGGVMLSLHWNVQHIFLAGVIPCVLGGAAIEMSRRLRR